jgi:hypothetical protein
MKANEVLLWLSARREGSWQQYRQAVEELHSSDKETNLESDDEFPLHQQLRLDLERLGHAEFFATDCKDGWRIAPPVLAAHSFSGGVRGVLCGARSPAVRERVIRAGEKLNCETVTSPTAPDLIRFYGPNPVALNELASEACLHFQPDAPLAILTHLPPCDAPSRTYGSSEFPQGTDWIIHRFDTATLAWRKIERHEAQAMRFGVLRFTIYFQRPRFFLRWKNTIFEMPRAIALYALLRRHKRDVLRYNIETAMLSVPAICRPPRLLERALVLCSGLPPTYAAAQLNYSDVPPDIAHFAAELLRQPLA